MRYPKEREAYPSASEIVAENVRVELARQRMSARQLGLRLGESPQWAWRRTTGAIPWTIEDLLRIAQVLGRPASEFLPTQDAA